MTNETSRLWALINSECLNELELSQAYARLIEIEETENTDTDWSCWYYGQE